MADLTTDYYGDPIRTVDMIDKLEEDGFIVCHKDAADCLAEKVSDQAIVDEMDSRGLHNRIKLDTETALDIVSQAGYYVSHKDDYNDMLWELYQAKLNGDIDKKLHELFVEYLNTW